MKFGTAVPLFALAAAVGVGAQTPPEDDIPDFISDGPFALQVKGQSSNSSINGYLHTVRTPPGSEQMALQYDARYAPVADNSSYRFYFNYTGRMQSGDNEVGFILSDITVAKPGYAGLKGNVMSQTYRPNTNVALPVLGIAGATIDLTGFDADNKAFLAYQTDDSATIPNRPANVSQSLDYYNWAICWQTYYAVTSPFLSWVTAGKPHNPTCERVDLLRVDL